MNNAVIYNRVSSLNQNSYNKSVSLQAQESICSKFAHENSLKVKRVYKEIYSAYNREPSVLGTIIELKKNIIIISSVDRFSRSVDVGISMAKKAIQNKNKIVFIQEQFLVSGYEDIDKLTEYLLKTEEESRVLGTRIKKARQYLIDNGLFAGGAIPYGYQLNDRVLRIRKSEHNIINFIKLCKKPKISSDDLNRYMIPISKNKIYEPINCYDTDGKPILTITECLTNGEIADLLNSYKVTKRGGEWNASKVRSAYMSYMRQRNRQKKIVPQVSKKRSGSFMDLSDIKKDLGTVPENKPENNSGSFKGMVKPHQHTRSNNMRIDTHDVHNRLRRSSRINPLVNISFSTPHVNIDAGYADYDTNVNARDIFDANDTYVDMQNVKLFNEFKRFKKMMRSST